MNLFSRKLSATVLVCLWLPVSVIVQQTLTATTSGNDISDATIINNTRPGHEASRSNNYGSHPRLAAVAWTNSGYASTFRSMLRFKLDAIPAGSVIHSATLYLFSDPAITSSSDANGNE